MSKNQVIPEAAAEASASDHPRGADNATAVRAMLAKLERLNPDGTEGHE